MNDWRLRQALNQYLQHLRGQGLTEAYVIQQRSTLRSFLAHCQAQQVMTVRRITSELVLSFLKRSEGQSASHQREVATFLRRFLAFHKSTAMVDLRVHVRGYARRHVDWLTEDEIQRVFQTPMSPEQAVLIGAGLLNGLRRIETLRLTVRDARDGLRSNSLVVQGKSRKSREVGLQDDFAEILRAYLACTDRDDGPLLLMKRTKSERILEEFCVRFGRHFTFHTLRRSCARALWSRGVPLETIGELLGHESTEMTRRYAGLNLSDQREALARYRVARACAPPATLAR